MKVFTEQQRFNQWFIHLTTIGTAAIITFSLYHMYFGPTPQNTAPGPWFPIIMLFSMAIILSIYTINLKTRIDEKGVQYQFFPFNLKPRLLAWSDIDSCYVRTYSPIKEYGGWGYRLGIWGHGKAYSIKGNLGIQLILKNGKKLLLGTQQEDRAKRVIANYLSEMNVENPLEN